MRRSNCPFRAPSPTLWIGERGWFRAHQFLASRRVLNSTGIKPGAVTVKSPPIYRSVSLAIFLANTKTPQLATRADGHDAFHPRALVLFPFRPFLRGLPGRPGFGYEGVGVNDIIIGHQELRLVCGGGDLP